MGQAHFFFTGNIFAIDEECLEFREFILILRSLEQLHSNYSLFHL